MARITFTNRSIRTAVGTVAFGIAATLALGACGSSTGASLTPIGSASPTSSSDQAAPAAPKKVEKVAAQEPAAGKKTSTRSTAPAPKKGDTLAPAPKKGDTLKYVKIVEPFGSPGKCKPAGTTIEMTACVLKQVVDVDYTVDVLQRQRFEYGISTADRKSSLRDDANWLAKRTKTCSEQSSGGSIDQITAAQCLLKVSKARVASLS
jgi:uncharacterized protein YecT (DUF1311 family)